MGTYVLRRLIGIIPLLFLLTLVVFSLVLLLPGDPARTIAGGLSAPEARVEEVRQELGLDDPVIVQYARWVGNALQGDLGTSLVSERPVTEEIQDRLGVTVSVAVGGMLLAVLIGIPLGIWAGLRPGSRADRFITFATSLFAATPDFFLATALVAIFAVRLLWAPAIGFVPFTEDPVQWAQHLILPWITLGVGGSAGLARQVRGAMADVLAQDYVRTARSKGLRERRVIVKHGLKNAMIPVLTILGLMFAYSLGGTVILEYVFSLPGMGQYIFAAVQERDLPVIQGVTLVIGLSFFVINLGVDLLYGLVNPKVRITR